LGGERDHHCTGPAPQWSIHGLAGASLDYGHKLPLPKSVHTPSNRHQNRTFSKILIHSLKHKGMERGLARDQNVSFGARSEKNYQKKTKDKSPPWSLFTPTGKVIEAHSIDPFRFAPSPSPH